MNIPEQTQLILRALSTDGFMHLKNISPDNLEEIIKSLGTVMQITDVKINEESRALVTSSRELDFHTDHHKVDIIAWYCFKQSSEGGESIFIDAQQVLNEFTEKEKNILSQIQLHGHKIFDDDTDSHPLISKVNNQYRFYYSFWMVDKKLSVSQSSVLEKFQAALKNSESHELLLQPHDMLFIDNGRVLHGRKALAGDKNRLLKRFWISSEKFRILLK